MKSFALWCESKDDSEQEEIIVDMHFNLWLEHDTKRCDPFLDIGFMVKHLDKVSYICIYVPFSLEVPFDINDKELCDLGGILSKDSNITSVIFNETLDVTISPNSKITRVKDIKKTDKFLIYTIDFENDVTLEEKYGGTIIRLDVKKVEYMEDVANYFRFRICSPVIDCLVQSKISKNFLIESAISTEKFVDFRFNDIRSLHVSLLQEINNRKVRTKVEKLHFLMLTRADVDITNGTNSERQLENNIWRSYIGFEPKMNIVARHWRFREEDHFIIYVKMKIRQCNWKTIAIYLSIYIVMSMFVNLLSSAVGKYIFKF